jgi:hypothetical protein
MSSHKSQDTNKDILSHGVVSLPFDPPDRRELVPGKDPPPPVQPSPDSDEVDKLIEAICLHIPSRRWKNFVAELLKVMTGKSQGRARSERGWYNQMLMLLENESIQDIWKQLPDTIVADKSIEGSPQNPAIAIKRGLRIITLSLRQLISQQSPVALDLAKRASDFIKIVFSPTDCDPHYLATLREATGGWSGGPRAGTNPPDQE